MILQPSGRKDRNRLHHYPFPLAVIVDRKEPFVVLKPTGELDAHTAKGLSEHLAQMVADGVRHVAVHLGGLDFADLEGARALRWLHQYLESLGGKLVWLGDIPHHLRKLFAFAGLDQLHGANRFDSVEHARAALRVG